MWWERRRNYMLFVKATSRRRLRASVPSFLQGGGIMRLKNSKTAVAGSPDSLNICWVNLFCRRKLIPTLLQELKWSIQWVKKGQQPIIQHVSALYGSKKKKKKRKSSCILRHHMHEKGAIKEHISFIPGNFPNPWWAAGEREMLGMWVSRWQGRDFVVAPQRARFNVCEHELPEYICITEKIC